MKNVLSLIGGFFSFLFGIVISFFRLKENKKVNNKNDQVFQNEVKKIAKNAESTDAKTKQKAIDDMRRLISD
jgi:hypothetical protein